MCRWYAWADQFHLLVVLIYFGVILFSVPVGELFHQAIIPGLTLVAVYIIYILIVAYLKPDTAPVVKDESGVSKFKQIMRALITIFPPLLLVICVLGSIFAGIATPTESSAFGCVGAIILAIFYRTFSFSMIKEALAESVKNYSTCLCHTCWCDSLFYGI